jgi:GNAT superfamily N-acetyltransferase
MRLTLRKAVMDDIAAIERVMRESLTGLGPRTYNERQIASSLEHVAHIDRHLIADGTYFVAIDHGVIVGCGGWSRRGKLYAGSAAQGDEDRFLDPATEPARVRAMFVLPSHARQGIGRAILDRCEEEARAAAFKSVELMAMLSGKEMYSACGYEPVEDVAPPLADGTPLPLTRMRKKL